MLTAPTGYGTAGPGLKGTVTMLRTTLQPASTSPARAREFVTSALAAWDADVLIPIATLLTSELVTNACLHGRPGIELRLVRTPVGVRFEVFDASPLHPTPRSATPDEDGGRGLHLVQELAAAWGIAPADPSGTTVWFELEPS